MRRILLTCLLLTSTLAASRSVSPCHAARWSITPRATIALDSNGFSVGGMSGVTYRSGNATSGQFFAVQDDGSGAILFSLALDAAGNATAASTLSVNPFAVGLDDEGIALTTNLNVAMVSNETPSVRRIRLSDGSVISEITPPAVYQNQRANRGFESLALWDVSLDGFRLATANEEALTIDGPTATTTAGTVVRVQTYSVVGNPSFSQTATATKQFAYEVDPIHAGTGTADTRSGLSELIALPDKTLVAMERSLANSFSPPPYQNRLYEIDSSQATDTSAAIYDAGLATATYTPATKELLWSGAAGGGFGQNMEGLTVGPQLLNGNWLLVGVVDNGDPLSNNTIVTFEAAPIISADFDDSGSVHGGDFLLWQREAEPFPFLTDARDADGNRDGNVDADDLTLWQSEYGAALFVTTIPEPSSLVLLSGSLLLLMGRMQLPLR